MVPSYSFFVNTYKNTIIKLIKEIKEPLDSGELQGNE